MVKWARDQKKFLLERPLAGVEPKILPIGTTSDVGHGGFVPSDIGVGWPLAFSGILWMW